MTVLNANDNCSPLANAAVEIWQCDASGNYSQYGNQRDRTSCAASR